jgi:hypothetical protein
MQKAEGRVQNEKPPSEPVASEPQTEKGEVHSRFTSWFTDEEANNDRASSDLSEPSEPQTEKTDRFEKDEKGKETVEVNVSDEPKEDKPVFVRDENERREKDPQSNEPEFGSLGSLRFTSEAENADEDRGGEQVKQEVNLKKRGSLSDMEGFSNEADLGVYAFIVQWYTQHTLRYVSPATAREIAAEVGVEFDEALGGLLDCPIALADGKSVTVSRVVENDRVIGYWLSEC